MLKRRERVTPPGLEDASQVKHDGLGKWAPLVFLLDLGWFASQTIFWLVYLVSFVRLEVAFLVFATVFLGALVFTLVAVAWGTPRLCFGPKGIYARSMLRRRWHFAPWSEVTLHALTHRQMLRRRWIRWPGFLFAPLRFFLLRSPTYEVHLGEKRWFFSPQDHGAFERLAKMCVWESLTSVEPEQRRKVAAGWEQQQIFAVPDLHFPRPRHRVAQISSLLVVQCAFIALSFAYTQIDDLVTSPALKPFGALKHISLQPPPPKDKEDTQLFQRFLRTKRVYFNQEPSYDYFDFYHVYPGRSKGPQMEESHWPLATILLRRLSQERRFLASWRALQQSQSCPPVWRSSIEKKPYPQAVFGFKLEKKEERLHFAWGVRLSIWAALLQAQKHRSQRDAAMQQLLSLAKTLLRWEQRCSHSLKRVLFLQRSQLQIHKALALISRGSQVAPKVRGRWIAHMHALRVRRLPLPNALRKSMQLRFQSAKIAFSSSWFPWLSLYPRRWLNARLSQAELVLREKTKLWIAMSQHPRDKGLRRLDFQEGWFQQLKSRMHFTQVPAEFLLVGALPGESVISWFFERCELQARQALRLKQWASQGVPLTAADRALTTVQNPWTGKGISSFHGKFCLLPRIKDVADDSYSIKRLPWPNIPKLPKGYAYNEDQPKAGVTLIPPPKQAPCKAQKPRIIDGKKHGKEVICWPVSPQKPNAPARWKFAWRWKDGKLHGLQREWYANGTMKSAFHFKKGDVEGVQRMWFSSGWNWLLETRKDGYLHSVRKVWRPDTTLRKVSRWKDGLELPNEKNQKICSVE